MKSKTGTGGRRTPESPVSPDAKFRGKLGSPEVLAVDKANAVWETLMEGNKRYASKADRKKLAELAKGQKPFAIVLGCSDSRVPVEKIFDSKEAGEIFVVRAAGNVAADPSIIGSIEYAVEHLGVSTVVVLGHTECGAVKGAMAGGHVDGPLGKLLEHIEPACEHAGGDLLKAIELNVKNQLSNLMHASEVVKEALKDGKLEIVGAIYELETGKVRRI